MYLDHSCLYTLLPLSYPPYTTRTVVSSFRRVQVYFSRATFTLASFTARERCTGLQGSTLGRSTLESLGTGRWRVTERWSELEETARNPLLLSQCDSSCLPLLRYSTGDIYSGHWTKGQRSGFGRLEETAMRGSYYTGAWDGDKRSGYGVYEDKMKWVSRGRCILFDIEVGVSQRRHPPQ